MLKVSFTFRSIRAQRPSRGAARLEAAEEPSCDAERATGQLLGRRVEEEVGHEEHPPREGDDCGRGVRDDSDREGDLHPRAGEREREEGREEGEDEFEEEEGAVDHHERVAADVVPSAPVLSPRARTGQSGLKVGRPVEVHRLGARAGALEGVMRDRARDAHGAGRAQDPVGDRGPEAGAEPGALGQVEPVQRGEEEAARLGHEVRREGVRRRAGRGRGFSGGTGGGRAARGGGSAGVGGG